MREGGGSQPEIQDGQAEPYLGQPAQTSSGWVREPWEEVEVSAEEAESGQEAAKTGDSEVRSHWSLVAVCGGGQGRKIREVGLSGWPTFRNQPVGRLSGPVPGPEGMREAQPWVCSGLWAGLEALVVLGFPHCCSECGLGGADVGVILAQGGCWGTGGCCALLRTQVRLQVPGLGQGGRGQAPGSLPVPSPSTQSPFPPRIPRETGLGAGWPRLFDF